MGLSRSKAVESTAKTDFYLNVTRWQKPARCWPRGSGRWKAAEGLSVLSACSQFCVQTSPVLLRPPAAASLRAEEVACSPWAI